MSKEVASTYIKTKRSLTRGSFLEIYDALDGIKSSLKQVMHRWTAAAMRRQLLDTAEPILEQRRDVEKLRPQEFYEAREKLAREHAFSDKDGRPVVAQNQYVIDPSKKEQFEVALAALREKHKEKLDHFDAEVKKVNEFFLEKMEMPSIKSRLKLSWFNDSVHQEHLEILFDLIDMDVELTEDKKVSKSDKKPHPDTE